MSNEIRKQIQEEKEQMASFLEMAERFQIPPRGCRKAGKFLPRQNIGTQTEIKKVTEAPSGGLLKILFMKNELEKLMKLAGTPAFKKGLDDLHAKYKNDPAAKKEITKFIKDGVAASGKRIERLEKEINLRAQIAEISEIISLSYIAKKYFNRTRQWLYQRVNGNIVNGKECRFTDAELDILQSALKDISEKIGSLSVNG